MMKIGVKKQKLYIVVYQKKMMVEDVVQKKVTTIFLLVTIILAIVITMYILNYFQVPKAAQPESTGSSSSGEISLTVRKAPIIKDESQGSVSLTVLSQGG